MEPVQSVMKDNERLFTIKYQVSNVRRTSGECLELKILVRDRLPHPLESPYIVRLLSRAHNN